MGRVCIDGSDAIATPLRGWGRYVRELVSALRERSSEDGAGLELRVLDHDGPGPEVLWEQLTLPRLLRREGAAVVHSPNCFLPLRRPCPGVVTVHDLAFEAHPEGFSTRTGLKYRTLVPRAARSAERVICDSAFTRDDLRLRYGVDGGKVRVIPLAPALAAGDATPPEGPYVLAVGDLRPKKNFARLATALAELHAGGLPHRLVIAGVDAGERERIRAAAGDAPVELPGYVGDEVLDALMRGADLLVHPSLYEGFGLVLLEAMARGCPVAAARATALPETAGDAAAYFDPLDTGDIAVVIGRVLGDRELREELIERGRRRVREFSWERTAGETLGVYRELLG
jgi:glycosyltransferase involved in cell wall biosynthesis